MNPLLVLIVFFLSAAFVIECVVDILNIRFQRDTVPQVFADTMTQEKYSQSQQYLKRNTSAGLLASAATVAFTLLLILSGAFNTIDLFARSFNVGEIPTGLIFVGVVASLFFILQLPFTLWHTFVIEEQFGFNKTSPMTFLLDMIKTVAVAAVIGGGAFALIVLFFTTLGPYAFITSWAAITTLQLLLTFVAPVLILPLFNRYTPLDPGPLKDAIDAYAQQQHFTLQGVFVMDGSRRSTKANAFFTGFGRWKRVVLFDTLIQEHPPEEIVAILAHEVGHYSKGHIIKFLLLSILNTGAKLFFLSLLINNPMLFDAFAMTHTSVYASLIFFAILYAPIDMILSVSVSAISRQYEYQADEFAALTGPGPKPMIASLKTLALENLSNLTPHPWKVAISYSHPPVIDRISALEAVAERTH